MVYFRDSQQNQYVLTYNQAGEVTRVTEPGGQYLQINYTMTNITTSDFVTLASVQGTPPEGAWTTIQISDPKPYRYLRYLGPDQGYDNVAEIEFYDTNGVKLTGTPFGDLPSWSPWSDYSKAFDGNTGSYVDDSHASGSYCGIDLGAGKAAVVGSIRYYPRGGFAWRMCCPSGQWWNSSAFGKFQGGNMPPGTIDVISSVTSSDGRTIHYNYAPFADPTLPAAWITLTGVTYEDGTAAAYTYQQILPSTKPLITSFVDPRYKLPFTKASTVYSTSNQQGFGQISQQVNYDTGEVLNTLSSANGVDPVITGGNGGVKTIGMNHATGTQAQIADPIGSVTSRAYDAKGYVSSITDPLGHAASFVNSSLGSPLQVTQADGGVVSYSRDSLGLPLSHTDPLGNITTYARDASHRVTGVALANGARQAFAYNYIGQITTAQLANGASVNYAYSASGLMTAKTDAAGQVWSIGYDAMNRPTSMTDPKGNTTKWQVSTRGKVTKINHPNGTTKSFGYDTFGNNTAVSNELGQVTQSTYDTFNRLTATTDPLGHTTQYVYRSGYFVQGKPDKVILPSGKTIANTYDLANHLTAQTTAAGTADAKTTSYAYNPNGSVTAITDPQGKVTSYTYDSMNRGEKGSVRSFKQIGLKFSSGIE